MIDLENRDRELVKMGNLLDEDQAIKKKYHVLSQEQLTLIAKLQKVSS